jgi:hypothetical protein
VELDQYEGILVQSLGVAHEDDCIALGWIGLNVSAKLDRNKEALMEKHQAKPAASTGSVVEPIRNSAEREPNLELYDEMGLIPTFPPPKVDEFGRLLPISDEERAARHSAAMRALAALDKLPDNDPPDAFVEMMRGLDSRRPPGYKHFEGMY